MIVSSLKMLYTDRIEPVCAHYCVIEYYYNKLIYDRL